MFILLLVALGAYLYPKYDARIAFAGIFLLIDLACWKAFISFTKTLKPLLSVILRVWYWLPMVFLTLFFLISIFLSIQFWPSFLRVYLPGIMVVLYLGKFLYISLFLLGELLLLPVNIINAIRRMIASHGWTRFRFFSWMGLFLAFISNLILFSGFVFWIYDFKVVEIELPVKNLPKSFDGYRIVHLSDIHLGSWTSRQTLQKAVDQINKANPDVVLFTGDMVNYATSEAWRFQSTLEGIKTRDGAFSILGNHDYGDYVNWDSPEAKDFNNRELAAFYHVMGWHLLKNESFIIQHGNDSLAIIGVENWSRSKLWGRKGDLPKAREKAGLNSVKILLSHDPTHWSYEVIKTHPDIILTLSGHTHGMQLGILDSEIKWSPASMLFPEWGGLYNSTKSGELQYLYVNTGLGHLGIPARILLRPEITVLVLKRQ